MTKNYIFMAIIVIIVLVGGAMIINSRSTPTDTTDSTSGTSMMADDTVNTTGDAMQPSDATSTVTGAMERDEATEAATMVMIKDFAYAPKTITIKVGDTVTWENQDSMAHTATADDESFDTGLLAKGEKGSVTFDKAGTYAYHCTPHPQMKGTIIVE